MIENKIKIAGTKHAVHELIKNRWSPRAFNSEMVPRDLINSLFEAAIWAPSSRNEQPWRFIYGCKSEDKNYDKIFSTLAPRNQIWAKDAPMLVLTVAKKYSGHNNQENFYALYDLGQAVSNFSLQATSLNLFCHQMGGFDKEKATELFELKPDFIPVTVIAVGYLGNPDILPDDFRELELKARTRNELELTVYKDEFKP
ncbi:MAG: nitroreductase family protein [Bacteroidales bacterium]